MFALPKMFHTSAMIYQIMEIMDSSYETHYDKYEMAKYTRTSEKVIATSLPHSAAQRLQVFHPVFSLS